MKRVILKHNLNKLQINKVLFLVIFMVSAISWISAANLSAEVVPKFIGVREHQVDKNNFVVPIVKADVHEINKEVVKVKEIIDSPVKLTELGEFSIKHFCDCDDCKKLGVGDSNNVVGITAVANNAVIKQGTKIYIDNLGIRLIQPNITGETLGKNVIWVYVENCKEVKDNKDKSIKVCYLD